MSTRAFHTEHETFDCCVVPYRLRGVRLFRSAPASDAEKYDGTLHEVAWSDVRVGDILFAVLLDESHKPACIPVLQFWRVREIDDDILHIDVNNVVGAASDGEYVYDRISGMLPPLPFD